MLKRVWTYASEMYPPAIYLPYGALSFLAPVLFALGLARPSWGGPVEPGIVISWTAGALSLTLFSFLLRVMDEVKDWEVDKRVFPNRPSARGAITKRDLQRLVWWVSGGIVLLNVWQPPVTAAWALLVLFYCFLMYHWFFWPEMARHLVVAVATHNPVVPLCALYALSFLAPLLPKVFSLPETYGVVLFLWLPVLAWEVGRKIRDPGSESDYVTYSKLFGFRKVSLALALLLLFVSGIWMVLGVRAQVAWWVLVVFLVWPLWVVVRLVAFSFSPAHRPKGFRAEMDGIVMNAMAGAAAAGAWLLFPG